jgi:hypothetical protein
MQNLSIENLVEDWGGFEKLIAELHTTGDVTVERNVALRGRSGAERQIDVLIRHKQGLYEHLVVVECKYWNRNVERLHVDALANTVRELGASRGVIFSSMGFQSGAITQAEHDGIDLFTVREPTDSEWGSPGRHVSLYLHVISLAPGPVNMEDVYTFAHCAPSSNSISLVLNPNDQTAQTTTPIETESGREKTLEAMIGRCAREAGAKAYSPKLSSFNGSLRCQILGRFTVNVVPTKDIKVFANGGCVFIRKMSFDLGLRVDQTHIAVDRAKNFVFALAVEDCVKCRVFAASRRPGDEHTELVALVQPAETAEDPSDVVQNNSIISVWLGPLFPFDDFAAMKPGETKFAPAADVAAGRDTLDAS